MHILHIDCSPRKVSHSRQLSAALVARLLALDAASIVIRRDLGRHPIPHADGEYAAALASPVEQADGRHGTATGLSEELIAEIESADALVIGTPLNNFTVPSVLKAWIDQVLRMGRTIIKTPTGEKVGLLRDRPVYIGIASGGVFTGERARQPDFLMPYLTAAFGCVGLRSLQFFPLQATAFLDDDRLAAERHALVATMDLSLGRVESA
ncbi:NAD(P)H-dependent oxidoreductase [Massilia sp. METH4]|uniref:FMN-dependent NADH-azoreductase n=1 Tax=Massilia sp. METH4 TaxID=3123041 RepID=UPI0030D04DA8